MMGRAVGRFWRHGCVQAEHMQHDRVPVHKLDNDDPLPTHTSIASRGHFLIDPEVEVAVGRARGVSVQCGDHWDLDIEAAW